MHMFTQNMVSKKMHLKKGEAENHTRLCQRHAYSVDRGTVVLLCENAFNMNM